MNYLLYFRGASQGCESKGGPSTFLAWLGSPEDPHSIHSCPTFALVPDEDQFTESDTAM